MDEFMGLVFAIIQVANATSGLRMVHITGVPDQAACEEILSGARENDFGGTILVERAECVNDLPADYVQALLNKPIPDTMIVSYQVTFDQSEFPVRHLFYGVAKNYQSPEGCKALMANYRRFSTNIRCINGYD